MTNDHNENLRLDLQRQIAGEVRFDRISRALYSTDASVYQIEPQGVVIPRIARRPDPHRPNLCRASLFA